MRSSKLTAFLAAGLIAFSGVSVTASYEAFSVAAAEANGFTYTAENGEAVITGCNKPSGTLTIPSSVNGNTVTAVGEKAFAGCSEIEKLIIPDSVSSVENGAFSNCTSLKSVEIGSGLSRIGLYAFGACSELSQISVSSGNSRFSSKQNMLLSKDGKYLIQYAGSSSAVSLPNIEGICEGAFFGRCDIHSVNIPSSVTEIDDYAFSGCMNLEKIVIPGSVSELGKACFMNCTGLVSAEIQKGAATDVPKQYFSMCSSLSELILPEGIKQIGIEAFFGCPSLKEIHIPDSVTAISENAVGKYYDLRTSQNAVYSTAFISGSENSAAQKYAEENGIRFYSAKNIILGDTDLNGYIDASDASLALSEYAISATGAASLLTYTQKLCADYDKNGNIDASDASLILAEYARRATTK